ncbi:MAG: peptidase, partial [Rhodobacteraceae bacterium]|nr:peptidase [Paracoccaceae bacterium]
MTRLSVSTLALAAALALPAAAARAVTEAEVAATYGALGEAVFADTATAGAALQSAVRAFLAAPSAEGLAAARDAWKAARVPYLQTEVFRFGNPLVDDWEPQVNAWPLDEGLIDYVDRSYLGGDDNPAARLDVIANPQFSISGHAVDASVIDAHLLRDVLHDAEGVEANVATGYHAIEFLLWGQDLNGTDAGAGDRPWTDYATGDACTHGHCDRRGAYLAAATGLLVDDL